VVAFRGQGAISAAAFSQDGTRLAGARFSLIGTQVEASEVILWDALTGNELVTLKPRTVEPLLLEARLMISGLRFTPDGSRLVVTFLNGAATVFDSAPINREFLPRELAPPPRPAKP
jgi:hypothetical protein